MQLEDVGDGHGAEPGGEFGAAGHCGTWSAWGRGLLWGVWLGFGGGRMFVWVWRWVVAAGAGRRDTNFWDGLGWAGGREREALP